MAICLLSPLQMVSCSKSSVASFQPHLINIRLDEVTEQLKNLHGSRIVLMYVDRIIWSVQKGGDLKLLCLQALIQSSSLYPFLTILQIER
jgi:hypothetical protein